MPGRRVRTRVMGRGLKRLLGAVVLLSGVALGGCTTTTGVPQALPLGTLSTQSSPTDIALGIQLMVLLTVLSLVPAVLIMTTSFIRIVVVLSFTRSALGISQLPPNQVLMGLALFLTVFVMAPVGQQAYADGLQPYMQGDLAADVALTRGIEPVRQFMFRQTREKDLALFISLAKLPAPRNQADVPTHVLIPAFIISELKIGFQMGFLILIPFLVIDMVVSSTLMSMGMMMLPPTTISLPFKVLLFVLTDGWHLIVRSLVTSFQ